MPDLNDAFKKLPPETQEILAVFWDTLPLGDKAGLLSLINGLPTNANMMRALVRLSAAQLKVAFGQKSKIAIVGPANVGKSTLYNQLIQNSSDKAEVSPLPGTTRTNRSSDAGLFSIIDTPGADAVGEVGDREREEALSAAQDADFLIILFDAIQGIKQTELDLFHHLNELGKPYIVVLNKIDLVKRHQKEVIALVARNLKLEPYQVIPLVATSGHNLNLILGAIAVAEPGIVAALGQAMPAYRWQLAWRTIASAASASAAVALTPIPVIDFIPLIAIQSVMVISIARIYSYKITPARARELIAAFGLGFLARTLFNELSKLGGLPGWLLSAGIAASTTVAMGYASRLWFEKGEKISGETIQAITKTVNTQVLSSLRRFASHKPGQKTLEETISASLEKAKLDEIQLPEKDPLNAQPGSQIQPPATQN